MNVAERIGVPEGRLIPGPAFMTIDSAIQRVLDLPGVLILHGATGTGKRTAIRYWGDQRDVRPTRIAYTDRTHQARITRQLASLVLSDAPRYDSVELQRHVIQAMAAKPVPVWLDPDRFSANGVRLVRHIWEESGAAFPLLISCTDTGLARVTQDAVLLDSAEIVRFRILAKAEIITWIPGYHPLYRDAPDSRLVFIDDHYAHGLLSRWKTFTNTAARVAIESGVGAGRLSDALLKATLKRLDNSP
jgi:hypothetical protein